jgi:hypothetical protein
MKKESLLFLLILPLLSHGQLSFEHGYVETNNNLHYRNAVMEKVVNLSSGGYKYAIAYFPAGPAPNYELKLYNMDHTLYRTITLPNPPACAGGFHAPDRLFDAVPFLEYISDNLFDTDTLIEMVINWVGTTSSPGYTLNMVYKEDGTILLPTDNCLAQRVLKVYKTDVSTFKLMSKVRYSSGVSSPYDSVSIYSLPGTIPCDVCFGETSLIHDMNNETGEFRGYPNPATDYFNVDFEFPPGSKKGTIDFYNLQGILVKSFHVDNSMRNIRLTTDDIAAGTYFYQLKSDIASIGSKKMIVIK